MDVRIKLKVGKIEMEFEGSNSTFEQKIEPILTDLLAFAKSNFDAADLENAQPDGEVKPKGAIPTMTVKSVAGKLGANSGSDLLYAAIASLVVIKQKETFSRQEVNDEMKGAVGYYKTSYTSNLSNYIDTLCKQGTIIETAKDNYAVQDSARVAMEQKLAQ